MIQRPSVAPVPRHPLFVAVPTGPRQPHLRDQTIRLSLRTRAERPHKDDDKSNQPFRGAVKAVGGALAAISCAAVLAVSPSAEAAERTLRLPVAERKEIYQVQETLLEAWSVVDELFYDASKLVRLCTLPRKSTIAGLAAQPATCVNIPTIASGLVTRWW